MKDWQRLKYLGSYGTPKLGEECSDNDHKVKSDSPTSVFMGSIVSMWSDTD